MIGLGRMGANLTRRLIQGKQDCVVYDVNPDAVAQLEHEGADGAATLEDLVGKLSSPRVVWIMVPRAVTDSVIDKLADLLSQGDIIIDGGNGYYRDDVARAARLNFRGIRYMDVGTSGGVFGLRRVFYLMVGGDLATFNYLIPVFAALAPGFEAAPRTFGRRNEPSIPKRDFSTADLRAPATS
jgi:6-phosphogluconate dehydrogenase